MNLYTRLSPIKLAAAAAAITLLYSCTAVAPARPSGTPSPVSPPASSPVPPPTAPPTAVPSATPAGSGPALTETFASEMYGISISYPAGWSVQRASEPWTGDPFFFREPVADFLYDPSLTDHLFLALASEPLSGKTPSSWAADLLAAEGCDATEPVVVDGADGLIGSDCDVVLAGVDDRGYIIWLYVSGDDPAVREVYNRAWFDQVLATVQLGAI